MKPGQDLHCDPHGFIQPVAPAAVVSPGQLAREAIGQALADLEQIVTLHVERGVYDEKTAAAVMIDVRGAFAPLFQGGQS